MRLNIKIPLLISVTGVTFGYFVLSPFAMYIAHKEKEKDDWEDN